MLGLIKRALVLRFPLGATPPSTTCATLSIPAPETRWRASSWERRWSICTCSSQTTAASSAWTNTSSTRKHTPSLCGPPLSDPTDPSPWPLPFCKNLIYLSDACFFQRRNKEWWCSDDFLPEQTVFCQNRLLKLFWFSWSCKLNHHLWSEAILTVRLWAPGSDGRRPEDLLVMVQNGQTGCLFLYSNVFSEALIINLWSHQEL